MTGNPSYLSPSDLTRIHWHTGCATPGPRSGPPAGRGPSCSAAARRLRNRARGRSRAAVPVAGAVPVSPSGLRPPAAGTGPDSPGRPVWGSTPTMTTGAGRAATRGADSERAESRSSSQAAAAGSGRPPSERPAGSESLVADPGPVVRAPARIRAAKFSSCSSPCPVTGVSHTRGSRRSRAEIYPSRDLPEISSRSTSASPNRGLGSRRRAEPEDSDLYLKPVHGRRAGRQADPAGRTSTRRLTSAGQPVAGALRLAVPGAVRLGPSEHACCLGAVCGKAARCDTGPSRLRRMPNPTYCTRLLGVKIIHKSRISETLSLMKFSI